MRHSAQLLSLATLTALLTTVDVAASQPSTRRPGFSEEENGSLLAQIEPAANVSIDVEGILAEGHDWLSDSNLYDAYLFEDQAGQPTMVQLDSQALKATKLGEKQVVEDSASQLDLVLRVAERADNLLDEGFAQAQVSQFREAIQSWQEALALYRNPALQEAFPWRSRREAGRTLANLCGGYYYLSQYQQSIESCEQALTLAHETRDTEGEFNSLNTLGLVYATLGQYQQAVEIYEQALAVSQEGGNSSREGTVLNNMGSLRETLGQYQQAIELYEEALIIFRANNRRLEEGRNLSNLGIVYRVLGEYQRAIEHYEQALLIAREVEDFFGEGNALGNLGNAYDNLAQYSNAIEFYQQQLIVVREIGDRQSEGTALGGLGGTYLDLGEYEQAVKLLEQQLSINQDIGDREGQSRALGQLGLAFIRSNQYSQAESVLRQSIELRESLRSALSDEEQIYLADTQRVAYQNLEIALISQYKTAEALAITERGRGRAFVLQLASRLAGEAERAALAASPLAQVPTVAEIQQIARDTNTTLVTYSQILDQALYIWVVQPCGVIEFRSVEFEGSGDGASVVNPIASIDGPVYRSTTPDSELAALVNDSRATVIVEGAGTDPQQLQDLHQILIAPIADLLPNDPEAKVAFIPQGNLFLVPFAALQDENGTHLIEKHTILTAPSIQVFGLANNAVEANGRSPLPTDNALIVGNPVMPTVWAPTASGEFADIQLSDLPGAEREAVAIGDLFQRPALIGDQATEARIKQALPNASVIHLATHGLLEYGTPEASGVRDLPGAIALTPGNGEDGLLTSAEILGMDLQAELAVLSACDTGRGRITGDGVVGLSRALITAGVPSVLVSLWAVPDAPTAELMTEFYNQLAQGQDKAQALRQAMLITLQQHPEPRNWAAFTLIGSPN